MQGIDRRGVLRGTAMTLAATQLGGLGAGMPRKRIKAGVLDLAYAEAGPSTGSPVLLLHGWPYDVNAFSEVAPILAGRGHRVIMPNLRGYGPTRFLASETMRNGQPAALAADAVALLDALEIKRALLGGFDWGARTAGIVAALWPERAIGLVTGMVAFGQGGYLMVGEDGGIFTFGTADFFGSLGATPPANRIASVAVKG